MSGLSSMESKACCRMGVLTVTYYLWTTFIAVVVGIVLVLIIKPGYGTDVESNRLGGGQVITSADALLDLVRYSRNGLWEILSSSNNIFVGLGSMFLSAKQILNMGLEAWTTFFSTYFYLILGVITIINVNVWTYWWVRYCSVSGIENTLKGYFTQNMKILSLCRFKPVLLVFSSVAQKDNVFPCSYKQWELEYSGFKNNTKAP